jgi:hypothetical protein
MMFFPKHIDKKKKHVYEEVAIYFAIDVPSDKVK